MIFYEDILHAKNNIRQFTYETPLEKSYFLSGCSGAEVFLKLECQQVMKAFKIRGAFNKLLSLTEDEKKRGIMAASSGNHGASVSYAASCLDINLAKIYVPKTTPESKKQKILRYGAELVLAGRNYDETYKIAKIAQKSHNLTWIDSCSDKHVIAGQGTVGLEILDKIPDIDVILVPIGGGSLITGVSVAAKAKNPDIRIIGVQTEACPAMLASMNENNFYEAYPSKPSVCEALIGGVGEIPYQMAKQCIDEVLLVREDTIKEAVVSLLENDKVLAEPSAAVGAALLMENGKRFKGKKVAVVISGANIDIEFLKTLLGGEQGE